MSKVAKRWLNWDNLVSHLSKLVKDGYFPTHMEISNKLGREPTRAFKYFGGRKGVAKKMGCKLRQGHQASDGHVVSSYYEYLFDEFLSINGIAHEIDGYINEEINRSRFDFKIGDVFVEIWGVTDSKSNYFKIYNSRRIFKEKMYKELNLKLISIEGNAFRKSSDELQIHFMNKLKEFDIKSLNNESYPKFAGRKLDYWNETTVIEELKKYISKYESFPIFSELLKNKRSDLAAAIKNHGGYRYFAKLLGFGVYRKVYCEKEVIQELLDIRFTLGHLPSDAELQKMNKGYLAGMIKRHGGYGYFRELINGARDKRPWGYWNDENNIVIELVELKETLGHFPKYDELGHIAKGIDKSRKGMHYFEEKVNGW